MLKANHLIGFFVCNQYDKYYLYYNATNFNSGE